MTVLSTAVLYVLAVLLSHIEITIEQEAEEQQNESGASCTGTESIPEVILPTTAECGSPRLQQPHTVGGSNALPVLGSKRQTRQAASINTQQQKRQARKFTKVFNLVCSESDKPQTCGRMALLGILFFQDSQGILLNATCNEGYFLDGIGAPLYTYNTNGTWSPTPPQCRPCGRMNSAQEAGLLNVSDSSPTKSQPPWLVVIYKWLDNFNSTCSGILISPHIVITTASCVYDSRMSPQKIQVAVSKRYKHWDRHKPGAVTAEVRKVAIPPGYSGAYLSKRNVALIDLKTSVAINSYIMPACVDWGRDLVVTSGQLGTGAVWHPDGGRLLVEYSYYALCRNDISTDYRHLLPSDKFCVKPIHGRTVFDGHSLDGSGVTFERNGVHYIKGVYDYYFYNFSFVPKYIFPTNLGDKYLLDWLQHTKRSFDDVHYGS